jgi:hypothetical protein
VRSTEAMSINMSILMLAGAEVRGRDSDMVEIALIERRGGVIGLDRLAQHDLAGADRGIESIQPKLITHSEQRKTDSGRDSVFRMSDSLDPVPLARSRNPELRSISTSTRVPENLT